MENSNNQNAFEKLLYYSWTHELRGKTRMINSYALYIKEQLNEPTFDLNEIKKELEIISRVANEIDEFDSPFKVEDIWLNSFLAERIAILTDYHSKFTKVKFYLQDIPLTVIVKANQIWLRRAIDILIDNSVEAMQDTSEKKISITAKNGSNFTELSFSDTGKGINQETIPLLFNTPSTGTGRGRGLFIAKLIFSTYGGKIKLSRTGHDGTTMVIRLPIEKSTEGDLHGV